jgi:DNA-binding beta-propeller fold protein YncE
VITIDGISQPKSISVNPNDGYCWVLDPFTQKAAKLSSDGAILVQATVAPAGGVALMAPSLTASGDGGCWVALMVDTINDTVLKLSADGKQALKVSGFAMPSGLAFDPKDNGCWVADSNHGAIIKISSAGKIVATIKGFDQPKAITVAYPVKQ